MLQPPFLINQEEEKGSSEKENQGAVD